MKILLISSALLLSAPLAMAQDAGNGYGQGGERSSSLSMGRSSSRSYITPLDTDTIGDGDRIAPRPGDTTGNSGALGAETAKQHQMFGN